MKNYLIGFSLAALAVVLFAVGFAVAPKGNLNPSISLGGYNPSTQFSSGFTSTLGTSTAFTGASMCNPTNVQWLGTTAVATATNPTAASTSAACNLPLGAVIRSLVINDSTNTVNYVAGSGQTFKCQTLGVGTTTITGGCTGSQFSLPASTTVLLDTYFDTSTSVLKTIVHSSSN